MGGVKQFLRLIQFLIWGQWVRLSEEDEQAIRQHIPVIAGWVTCPDCGEELPIGLTPLRLGVDEDGQQVASADLQMDDLWAHAWTHGTDREPE